MVLDRRARHDHVGVRRRGRVVGLRDRVDGVARRELRRPSRRRVHAHIVRASVAEGGERGAREPSGADEQHARSRPVGDAALGEIERESHERAAFTPDTGLVLHLARGLRGALEESLEVGGRGALGASAFERAAHLAGDLALADDDGFETGCHGEEVSGDGVAVHEPERRAELVGLESGDRADGADRLVDGGHRGGAGVGVEIEIEVGLEAVAGGDDDRATHGVVAVEDARRRAFRVR